MDRPALFTATAVGYAVGFLHSLDFAVVDVTLNYQGLPEVLRFSEMTPYAVSQHVKALRRCGVLIGYMLVFAYFATARRSQRRRWTRLLLQASSSVTTIAGVTLHYASILRWGSVECPRVAKIGFVLLGFGYSSSSALGCSLLQGETQAFPHPKRDVLIAYQAFANYLGRSFGLILATTLSPDLCFFVHAIMMWTAAVATFSADRSIRNYGQEDYECLADLRAMSVEQSLSFDAYRSKAFLRALLAVGIPIAAYDQFTDAWQWTAERIHGEFMLAKDSIGTSFLYENIARALLGGLLISYNVIHKDYAIVKKAKDWKRAMLWSASVSPAIVITASIFGPENGWYFAFVVADTMLASYWMNAASCFMPGLFPVGTKQAGMCLAWIIRLSWKLAAEPTVLWSLELFGIRFLMWSNVALRVLCTIIVIFATCTLRPRYTEGRGRAANGATALPSENFNEVIAFFELFDFGAVLLASKRLSTLAENALKRIAVTDLHALVLHSLKHRPGFIGVGVSATETISAMDAEVLQIPEELLSLALENCVIGGISFLCETCKETPGSPECILRTFRQASDKTAITRCLGVKASCFVATQDLIDFVSQFRRLQVCLADDEKFDHDALNDYTRQNEACKIEFLAPQKKD